MGIMEHSLLLTPDIANEDVPMVGLFPRGYVSVVAGEPGIGKTWLMLEISRAVASGTVGIGDPVKRYDKGRVLIFAGETGVRLLASRVKLLGGIHPVESVRVLSSHVLASMSIDVMVNTAIGRKNISEAVASFKPDIVFFDTMISFTGDGRDESSQVDMTDCIRGLSHIAHDYNAAIVLLHHFRKRNGVSKGEGRSMDDVIGTSAYTRLASLVIGIERKRDVRTVRCLKSWWDEFAPFAFTIAKTKNDGVVIRADYNYNNDGSYSISKTSSRVAEYICEKFKNEVFSVMDVVGESGISRSAVQDGIGLLQVQGRVQVDHKDGNTRYYALTGGAGNYTIKLENECAC